MTSNIKFLYLTAFLLVMFVTACSASAPLKCHYRVTDITPKDSVVLAGFAARKGLSTTIHYPLKTHCLVLKNPAEKICIITNDLMEISIELADKIKKEISQKSGIPYDRVFIHCTHTHSAPRTGGECSVPGKPNWNYRNATIKTIVNNAVTAILADERVYQPFSLEIAKSGCNMNTNRCEKNGPCDRDVYALKFIDKKGRPIVALLNYSCHPVSLDYRSLVVSADFPGVTCNLLSEEWKCPVFYFTGASGNINPAGGLKADTAYTEMKGRMLAESIKNAPFEKLSQTNVLKTVNKEIHLPYQIDSITADAVKAHVEQIIRWKGVSGTWVNDVYRWQERTLEKLSNKEVKNYLPFQIAAVNVGGVILFFTQGEPFCEYQQFLRKTAPGRNILFIAYTNGQNSYLPSRHAYGADGYDYETKQMHVYIDAPFPLSDKMPDIYETAMKNMIEALK
ncbi:MAG: neutral/alkaline non-lysosomal ceramidase N-terminal domain-containing protein [Dysgonamonadaceae bacterium]|jgi:hypothetical protein|nr:neutral/alkaline non-lysosomal ceramidase N-terminal domain-containing protein [Dysgonamonadaceae bacterium]